MGRTFSLGEGETVAMMCGVQYKSEAPRPLFSPFSSFHASFLKKTPMFPILPLSVLCPSGEGLKFGGVA